MALDYQKLYKEAVKRGDTGAASFYQKKLSGAYDPGLQKTSTGYTGKLSSNINPKTGVPVELGELYTKSQQAGDIEGQLQAATMGDAYRISQGQQPINQELIARLQSQLPERLSTIDPQYDALLKDNATLQQALLGMLYQKPNFQPMIKDWGQNMRQSLLAKIEQAKQAGISGYSGLENIIRQGTQQALSENDIERARALQRVYEATEATGGYRGGQSITGQIQANTMAGQVAGQIRQDELNKLAEVAKAIEQIKQQAEQEKVSAEADVAAKELQALMDAEKYGADYALRAAQQSLAERQFDFTKGLQQEQQRLEWEKFNASKEWQDFQKQFQLDEQAWARNESNPDVRRKILENEITQLKLLNLPRQLELELQDLEQKIAQGVVSMEQARAAIKNMQTQANLEQQRINLSKQQYLDSKAQAKINSYKSQIDQFYATPDPNTGAVTYNWAAIKQYIQNLNTTGQISDAEAKALLSMYGFSY